MKILHLVAGDLSGGAARGAYWLHHALLDLGVASEILTNSRNVSQYTHVHSIAERPVSKLKSMVRTQLDRLPASLYRHRKRWIFSTGLVGYNFTGTPQYKDADVVHLHWINSGFVNMAHLAKVDKPIVWTMRDMWPMTGGCHYAVECEKYKDGCGCCEQLASHGKYDLSRLILKRKIKKMPSKLIVVGISSWLRDCARKSKIFRDFDVRAISNNIDSFLFSPVDKKTAKKLLDLPDDKKVILVGAQNLRDPWKGFGLYLDSLRYLNKEDYLLLFFGSVDKYTLNDLGFASKSLGFLHDSLSLRVAYSAADVFVSPSTMEAFGKTIAEAMACRTPAVCFDATGPADIVTHKIDGYKAVPFKAQDLACGIEWVVNNASYDSLCVRARDKVVKKIDSRVVAMKYIDLYNEIR